MHHSLFPQALSFHQAGHLTRAEALYRKILEVEPDNPDALHYLGLIAHQTGKNSTAVQLIKKALAIKPNYIDAYNSLGLVLHELGEMDEAISSYRQALALKPDYAEVQSNLGNVFKDLGKLAEAAASFRQALSLRPEYAELHYNLANVLKAQGKPAEAIKAYQKALRLRPDYAEANFNMGITLMDQGRLNEAGSCFRKTLSVKPDYAEANYYLANILKDLGSLGEAVTYYQKAINLKPDNAEAYFNLGITHKDQGRLLEALGFYRKALNLKPDYAEVFNNLGVIYNDLGNLDEAVACFRRALTLKPDFSLVRSNLLMSLNYHPKTSVPGYLDEARIYGQREAEKIRKRFSDWSVTDKTEYVRVGLVSGDFRNHPVGYFLENLLTNIDREKIKFVAYTTNRQEDQLTARIRSNVKAWKSLQGLSDEDAAGLIHEDGVHVLLDLSGHTNHNRLPVFAWKPAPVQATWLGYSASTGIAEMDYIIADPVSVPESCQEQFIEKVWYLPETRFCFSPPRLERELPVESLPALQNGYITFGSFQNLTKINDSVLALWGRVFQQLPQARLRLQTWLLHSPAVREELISRLKSNGIPPEHVTCESSVPRTEYLAVHADVDIILDTFPFTGGTTTCEALWMGVPTLTLLGKSMIGRQGASLLTCAGLEDWICRNEEEYVVKAATYAADLVNLAKLRTGLRQKVMTSPLFDGPGFARDFEKAMLGMWRNYLKEN